MKPIDSIGTGIIKGFYKGKEIFLQCLFPRRCPVCDEIVPGFGELVCLDCLKKIKYIDARRCQKCGKKLLVDESFCRDCREREHYFVRGRSLYEYKCMAGAIYRFKYRGRREYADFFGEEIVEYLGEFIENVSADGIIPIPLHKKRLRKRGYNQAALLARAVGRRCNVPVYENFLCRVKNTRPLKALNPKERQNNLKKAFIIGQNDVKLKTIIIIDDIYTTGSTLDEAALVCRQAGSEKVYFITLANGESI